MARSRNINGPHELHPDVRILSARHHPDIELQARLPNSDPAPVLERGRLAARKRRAGHPA
jgi:hypothetical protein